MEVVKGLGKDAELGTFDHDAATPLRYTVFIEIPLLAVYVPELPALQVSVMVNLLHGASPSAPRCGPESRCWGALVSWFRRPLWVWRRLVGAAAAPIEGCPCCCPAWLPRPTHRRDLPVFCPREASMT